MDEVEVATVVAEINRVVQQELWFFFEVTEYNGHTLTINGGLDDSEPYEVELLFKNVFFISLPMTWEIDTSVAPLQLLRGEDAKKVNLDFQVQQGFYIFRFLQNGRHAKFGCLIGAAEIVFRHRVDFVRRTLPLDFGSP